MVFERGVMPEDGRSAVIFSLYKGKGERTECSNYRGISLLSAVGGFRAGRGCVAQIFAVKQRSKKAREKKWCIWVLWRRHTKGSVGRHYGKY